MKKITPLLLAALLLFTAACTDSSPKTSPTVSASANEQTYTGILEQIKDDMILVVPENDNNTVYTFSTEGIALSAQLGDKVTVTYTGDINDVDSLLEASKVETVK